MSKLAELIKELCPDGVPKMKLGAIGKVSMCKRILKADTATTGDVPFYKIGTFGKDADAFISYEKYEEFSSKYSYPKKGDILISAAGTIGRTVIYDGSPAYYQDSNIVWLAHDESIVLNKYLYYCYELQPWMVSSGGTISRLYNDNIMQAEIYVPPLPVQCEIVRILDNFTALTSALTSALTAELTAQRKRYSGLLNSFLSFEGRGAKDGVLWKKLDDIATEIYRGAGIKRDEVTEKGIQCVRYGEIYTSYNIWFDTCISHTIENKIASKKYFEKGDILFAITGESVEEIAKSCAYVGDEKCLAGGDIVVMKHKQNPKYLAYALATTNAQMQKSKGKVKSKVVHSSVPAIKEIVVPIPSLEEQQRIVDILDRFDKLCNDLSEGLPAEIAARQKQYEYYRDKLLTFKEKEA